MEGAEPLEDVEDIYIFEKLGLRSLQLNWNFDNNYAASCMSRKDYGVTGDGEELIGRLNELGILLDLSHSSENTMLDELRISSLPLMVSHTNSKIVTDHVRNVGERVLEEISRNRGLIGFTCIPPTLSKSGTIEDMADHVMHIHENFGSEVLGIGSGFLGSREWSPRRASKT